MKLKPRAARPERIRTVAAFAALVGGFAVDCVTPKGYSDWAFYVIAVVISIRAQNRNHTYLVAWLATALTVLGFFASSSGGNLYASIYSRTFGTVLIWAIVLAALSWRRADEKLIRLQKAVDGSGEIVFMTDSKGVFNFVNPAFTKTYGYTPEEVIGETTPRILKSGRVAPEVYRGFWQMLLEKRSVQGEFINKTKDGRLLVMEASANPIMDESGTVSGFLGVQRDITERKRAEEALRISEERFSLAFNASPEPITLSILADGRYIDVNESFLRTTGYKREEVIGHTSLELKFWALGERRRAMLEALDRGPVLDFENTFLTKSGDQRVGIISAVAVHVEGHPCLLAIIKDITEYKRAEEALRGSEGKFRDLADSITNVYFAVDNSSRITYWNKAAERLTGIAARDILGRHGTELFPELLGSPPDLALDEAIRSRQPRTIVHSIPIRDQTYVFESSFFPIPGGVSVLARDITERTRADEALRESEDRYRDLVEHSHDLICTHDMRGKLLSVNKEPTRILGYTQEELLSMNMVDLLPPDLRGQFDEYLAKIRREGYAQGLLAVKTRKGETRIWEYHNTLRTEGVSEPIVRGMAQDVTERKRAEKALHESEERFRSLFENATVGIYRTTPDGGILMANPALVKMLGYNSFEELSERNLEEEGFDANHPRAGFKMRLDLEGEVRGMESAWTRKDGTSLIVRESARAIRDSKGGVFFYDGIVEDVTKAKRAEEALVKLRHAVDASGEVVFMTDREGVFTFVNPEFTRLYGYTEADVVGKATPRILRSGLLEHEDYAAFWKTILDRRVARGEVINRSKAGQMVPVDSSVNPILDEKGNITGFLAIQRDVSQRKQLEEQFRQAQKMEAIGRLAGGVAHDFNNLLTIINGYSQLLLEDALNEGPRRAQLKEIIKAGERAASLTQQLLAFSRKQVLEPRIMDLNGILESMEKMLRRLIGEDVELRIIPGKDLGLVKTDMAQIEQVILNLAVNARDAMPQGGVFSLETKDAVLDEAYARTHSDVAPGRYVMLAVSDSGTGMEEGTIAHIFEPFFTTKAKGKGTGLGLSTVYGIVKQTGGHVAVYSEVGRGTTFKIYLPEVGLPAEAVASEKETSIPPRGSETILIVEDETAVRALATRVLRDCGYNVLESTSSEDAVRISAEFEKTIDLLLTDVIMPGMSGRNVAEHLAFSRPKMRVLYMSGYTDDAIVHHGVLEEGMSFLQKPFTPVALARKVREILDMPEVN